MIDLVLDDRYRLLRKLGEGGMAVVYLGNDLKLGRNVAIKILKEKFESHREVRTRFQHEARIISAFDHPNILKVFDYSGSESKRMWIVTELVHGRNLGQIVETAPGGWLHPVIAACIVKEVSKALSVAHLAGIVHRDIKPDNVMMTQLGQVKLMDFGIAKIGQENTMTQTGMFMGSPSYMSPEQVRGRDVDARSDIYSLGVMFYELTTGKLPFSAQSTADIAMKILNGQYQHPRFIKEQIPIEVNDLIVSMMTGDAKNRPQAIETVSRSIDRYLQNYGFESSSSELERCFRDPQAYGERLGKMLEVTALVALPTQLLDLRENVGEKLDLAQQKSGSSQKNQTLHIRSVQEAIRLHNEAAIDQPIPVVPEIRKVQLNAVSKNSVVEDSKAASSKNAPSQNMQRPSALPTPVQSSRLDHRLPRRLHTPAPRRDQFRSIVGQLPERRLRMREISAMQHQTNSRPDSSNRLEANPNFVMGSTPSMRGLPRQPHRRRSVANHIIYKEVRLREKGHMGLVFFALFTVFVTALIISQPNRAKEVFATNFALFQKTTPSEILKPQKNGKNTGRSQNVTQPKTPVSIVDSRVSTQQEKSKPSVLPLEKSTQEMSTIKEKPTKGPKDARANRDSSSRNIKPAQMNQTNQSNIQTAPRKDDVRKAEFESPTTTSKTESINKSNRVQSNQEIAIQKPTSEGKSEFRVSSTPAAEIWSKGAKLGSTNEAGTSSSWISLDAGSHDLELRRSGYKSKTVVLNLKANLPIEMPRVILERINDSQVNELQVTAEKIQVTISISVLGRSFDSKLMKTPIQIKMLNLSSREVLVLNATSSKTVFNLEKAPYEISVKRQNEIKSRKIDLIRAQDPITYSVDFETQGASP